MRFGSPYYKANRALLGMRDTFRRFGITCRFFREGELDGYLYKWSKR